MKKIRTLIGWLVIVSALAAPAAALTRIETPGAWYGERGVDGRSAKIVDGAYVQTHFGRVELPRFNGLPDLPLYLRITPRGEFKMCGQSHRGAGTYEWAHGEWHVVGPSFGVNACIYDYAGRLHIGAPQFGTQGFRWVKADNSLVLGDHTYADPARKIWEFTELQTAAGLLTIGQGETGCIALRGDARYMLEPGHCTFARADHANGLTALYMVKLHERKGVELALTDAELATFPPEVIVPPPPPPPQCPTATGVVNGVLEAPETYIRFLTCSLPAANYREVIRQLAQDLWKFGIGFQTGSDGIPRGRLFLPTANCPNAGPRPGFPEDERLGVRQLPECFDPFTRVIDVVENENTWVWIDRGGPAYLPFTGGAIDPPPPPPDEIAKLKARIAELEARIAAAQRDLHLALAQRDTAVAAVQQAIEELAQLQRKYDAVTCTATLHGPGWARSLFNIRATCEVVR